MLTARGHKKQRWKRPIRSFSPFPGEEGQIIFHTALSSLAFNYSSQRLSPLHTFSGIFILPHDPCLAGSSGKVWISVTINPTGQPQKYFCSQWDLSAPEWTERSLLSIIFKIISFIIPGFVLFALLLYYSLIHPSTQRLNERCFCQKSPFETKLVPISQGKWSRYLGQCCSCWHQRTSWINKGNDFKREGGRHGECRPNNSPKDCSCKRTRQKLGDCMGRRG